LHAVGVEKDTVFDERLSARNQRRAELCLIEEANLKKYAPL